MTDGIFDESFDIDRILIESTGANPEVPEQEHKPKEEESVRSPKSSVGRRRNRENNNPLEQGGFDDHSVTMVPVKIMLDRDTWLQVKLIAFAQMRPISCLIREVIEDFLSDSSADFVKSDEYGFISSALAKMSNKK